MRQLIFLFKNSIKTSSIKSSFIKSSSLSVQQLKYYATVDNPDLIPRTRSKRIKNIDLKDFSPDKIRNFCIISHIDSGKSTLSDRFIEETNLISKDENINQYTDKLIVERERGITVKSSTVSLIHQWKGENYLLNLIDTPGHCDFQHEVFRSMPVVEGAILLVDATKGIQAQTISHYNRAVLSELSMIPVLNKIDVSFAKPDQVIKQMKELLAFDEDEIFQISAKTGLNVKMLLDKVCELIPPPSKTDSSKCFEAIVFDSWHLLNEGVISLIKINNGLMKPGDKIKFYSSPTKIYEVKKLGIFHPEEIEVDSLYTGQIGILNAFIHDLNQVNLGDLIHKAEDDFEIDHNHENVIPKAKQMVYASLFPYDPADLKNLKQAIKRIHLTDKSVEIEQDMNVALGSGFRLGFQGLLHLDVFSQRLDYEFNAPVVITAPQVAYKVTIKGAKNIKQYGTDTLYIKHPFKLPEQSIISKMEEPMVKATIMSPNEYIDAIEKQTRERRGIVLGTKFMDQNTVLIENRYPLQEIITDFLDELKNMTSGYASFDYVEDGWRELNAVVLTFKINKEPLDELAMIVAKSKSKEMANEFCERIKRSLDSQLYDVVIHGCINSRIICKRELKATGKDVLGGKLHGASLDRKMKLIGNQEKGRKRLRTIGKIEVDRNLLINVLKKN